MKVELAEHGTRKWWKEGGNAVWGLGIQFDLLGEHRYGETEDDDEVVGQGWSLSLMLGGWTLTFYTQAAHEAVYGTEYGAPWFEVLRA